MDLVHSHAVSNEVEGLAKYDGTQYQFSMPEKKEITLHGEQNVLITEKMRFYTFYCQISNIG